jgi:antitoxin component of MazEF toxin-antitoxin module
VNTQIGKWGNSLAVRIPDAHAKELDLKEGMDVDPP